MADHLSTEKRETLEFLLNRNFVTEKDAIMLAGLSLDDIYGIYDYHAFGGDYEPGGFNDYNPDWLDDIEPIDLTDDPGRVFDPYEEQLAIFDQRDMVGLCISCGLRPQLPGDWECEQCNPPVFGAFGEPVDHYDDLYHATFHVHND